MENMRNITIKRLSAIFVAVIVVFLITVPCFASSDNGIDFSPLPVTDANAQSLISNGLAMVSPYVSSTYYQVFAGVPNDTVVYVYAWQDTSSSIPRYRFHFLSESPGQFYWGDNQTPSNPYFNLETLSYSSDTELYGVTKWSYVSPSQTVNVPVFADDATGLQALKDYLNSSSTSQPLSLALQPGNVAYIDITNTNATITLTQHTSIAYWQLTSTQYIGASNSLPLSGFTVPIAGTGMIDWVGVGRKTIQGQYNDWTSVNQISGSASDHQHVYAIVVNPLQNNITTGSGLDVSSVANGIINISVDPAWSVKIYQLENQFSLGVDSNTQSGDTGTGTYDSNTGQWNYTNDQTGESFEQQYGGMTTPESQFDSIHDFLENIANTISGFFSGAINAVSTLVGAGSSFFGVLGGLYSWLPPAVYSVLVSALIIVITIGVIKVFV